MTVKIKRNDLLTYYALHNEKSIEFKFNKGQISLFAERASVIMDYDNLKATVLGDIVIEIDYTGDTDPNAMLKDYSSLRKALFITRTGIVESAAVE